MKYYAVFFSIVAYWAIYGIFKIPPNMGVALAIATIGTLLLVYACAYIFSKYNVLKDYPLGSSLVQYSFVAISSIYLGDSMGRSLRDRLDLDLPPFAAAILVGVFCVASISESKVPAARQGDLPEIGRKITNLRSLEVVIGTIVAIIVPVALGGLFGYFRN